MRKVTNINSDSKQKFNFVLENGTIVTVQLNYVDNQGGWFYSLSYPLTGFSLNNRRLINSPNMLRSFRRIIPFGLACIVSDGQEPIYQDDFINERCSIYFLNSTEILTVETIIKDTLSA